MLFRVEGGRIVLEMLNQRPRLRSLIQDLRLAFIDAAAAAHRNVPWLEKIHFVPWLSLIRTPRRRSGVTTRRIRVPARPLPQPNRSPPGVQSRHRGSHTAAPWTPRGR